MRVLRSLSDRLAFQDEAPGLVDVELGALDEVAEVRLDTPSLDVPPWKALLGPMTASGYSAARTRMRSRAIRAGHASSGRRVTTPGAMRLKAPSRNRRCVARISAGESSAYSSRESSVVDIPWATSVDAIEWSPVLEWVRRLVARLRGEGSTGFREPRAGLSRSSELGPRELSVRRLYCNLAGDLSLIFYFVMSDLRALEASTSKAGCAQPGPGGSQRGGGDGAGPPDSASRRTVR